MVQAKTGRKRTRKVQQSQDPAIVAYLQALAARTSADPVPLEELRQMLDRDMGDMPLSKVLLDMRAEEG